MAVVLIVDDDEQARGLAEAIIRQSGHDTLSAARAEEAVAVLRQHPIDLLFTEIGLQRDGEAGLKLARAATGERPELPVLYTTGQGVTDRMRAMFSEPFGFVSKPYTAAALRAALTNLLSYVTTVGGEAAKRSARGTGGR
jgi:DNA-binding NtrC family response regulator